VYRHASTTWDESSPEERERAMGFQVGTTSHTKVTRLERNTLLGRSMDLEVHQLLEKQLQPFTNLCSWIVENPIHQVFQTHFPIPFHVFPTTLCYGGLVHQEGERPGHKLAN